MVEMAAVSIFIALLVLGIVDLGRVIFTSISVRDAVQEGAAFAAYTENADAAGITTRVRGAVSNPDLSAAQIDLYCSLDPRDLQDGTRVRIELEYDVDLVTPLIGAIVGDTITLSPEAEVERFFEECPDNVDTPIP
jgi:Flp pilus assembly protein TadG